MTNLLIATWNVNSIRARLPIILAWLKEKSPDVLLLQELKARDNDIPKFTQNDHIEKAFYYLNNKKFVKNPNKKYIDILFCSKKNKLSINYLSCDQSKLSKFNFKKIIYENVKKINLIVVKKSLYN
jgi:exonuclease III